MRTLGNPTPRVPFGTKRRSQVPSHALADFRSRSGLAHKARLRDPQLDLRALHKDLWRLIGSARSAGSICCSLLTEPGCRVSARSEMTSRRCHRPSTRLRSLCRQASQPFGTFQNTRGRFRSGVSGSAGITTLAFAPTGSLSMTSSKHAFHLVSRTQLRCVVLRAL